MKRKQKKGAKISKIIFSWLPFVFFINFFSPSSLITFLGFYFLLTTALFFTLRYFLTFPQSLVWTGAIIIYLMLRQSRLDNLLNTMLLLGILLTLEIYLKRY